ncbi:hypothetical protein DPEC_G00368040 [Dallia pectoralis]|nr:hypothetical protein DPEC_G00368040 [Dallia pectoralis]
MTTVEDPDEERTVPILGGGDMMTTNKRNVDDRAGTRGLRGETLDKVRSQLQEKMVNTVRTRDTPQPRLEERRQMVSTQTMTEDEPPPPVPEVRNYKQTIMVEVPREQRRGQRSRESTSGIREPQQGEPTLQTIDEDPGKLQQIRKGRFPPPVVMTPRYQGTPSQSDLSSEEELSARAARSRMPNPTEQQWAPRGNTRAQFNDNRRGPRRREDRSYPRRRRYDDHQQKERRRPSRDQGVRTRGQGRREWSNRDPPSNKPTSTDPEFTAKTRGIFRLIKATHHLGNVTAEHPPASIAKMADQLMAAIKPASPTTSTMTLIEGNARYWAQNTLIILRDHYQDDIQNNIQILIQLETWDWARNFDIATTWAKNQFGRRLRGETLDKVRSQLQEKMVNTVRTRDTPQPRLEERRQMVSTQTMTEDEPPPPVPEVRNYKQTIMVEVPREQRRGQRSRESTSGIREPQQGEPTLQTIDEDPGEATTNQEGPFVPPVVMTPRYQGTPSQSDLSSEEELSGPSLMTTVEDPDEERTVPILGGGDMMTTNKRNVDDRAGTRGLRGETLDKVRSQLQEKMVNTVRTRDTPQPRLEERRQMVSTQTMTEDEPPPPVPEVRNYKQTIMVEVPREQRRGQRSRESTSGIREPQQGEPTLQTIDEDPGEATTNQEGPFVPPVVMTPRYQGTPSQSDLSSEEELSGDTIGPSSIIMNMMGAVIPEVARQPVHACAQSSAEQQWAPRGNTRPSFKDNRGDPDEERTVPILGGGDMMTTDKEASTTEPGPGECVPRGQGRREWSAKGPTVK